MTRRGADRHQPRNPPARRGPGCSPASHGRPATTPATWRPLSSPPCPADQPARYASPLTATVTATQSTQGLPATVPCSRPPGRHGTPNLTTSPRPPPTTSAPTAAAIFIAGLMGRRSPAFGSALPANQLHAVTSVASQQPVSQVWTFANIYGNFAHDGTDLTSTNTLTGAFQYLPQWIRTTYKPPGSWSARNARRITTSPAPNPAKTMWPTDRR